MNFKTTLFLLVLVAIGVGVFFFASERTPNAEDEDSGQPAQAETETRYVLDSRPAPKDIVHVQLARHDQPALVFERTEKKDDPERMEDWRMITPLESRTESYMVDGLVTMLTGLRTRRSFMPGEGGVSLADAGLEPPAATITLRDKADTEYAAEIGKQVALSNDTYVRVVGGDEIIIVGRDMSRELKRKVDDYRAKSLMKLARNDARHVRIDHDGTTYDFTRGPDGEWVINEPVKAYAQADKVRNLVNALGSVRVEEFIADAPESLAAYGLESPAITIQITTEKKELVVDKPPEPAEGEEPTTQPIEPKFELVTNTYALAVGDYADLSSETRYIKLPDQPWVASATSQQLDRLIPKLSELRDPRVTRVKADDATRLEITADAATTTLTKQDGRWQGTGDLAELEVEAVRNVLAAFEDTSAIDYLDEPQDLAEYGLDPPRAILTVTTTGAVEPVTLHIGADTRSGRNTYVQLAGQSSVMVVSAERARELAVEPLSLRSRVITSGAPERIKRVSVQRGDKHYTLERKEDGKRWRMLEPDGAPPDPASVRELVNDLSRLRAREVVAKDDVKAYGLADPAITIRFVMEETVERPPSAPGSQPTTQATQPATQPAQPTVEPVEHTLFVGRKGDKTYARFDDVRYVFELDETVYKVLTGELIDRGLFDVAGEDVTYLKIEAPGGTVEFEHDGEQWIYPPDKFLRLSQKNVGDFVKELAELRVKAYMAYRDGDLARYGLEGAPVTVTMRLKDESAITLKVDQVRPGELPRKAAWVEQQRVFLLRPAEAEKLMRGLDYYVKPEAEETKKPSPPTP